MTALNKAHDERTQKPDQGTNDQYCVSDVSGIRSNYSSGSEVVIAMTNDTTLSISKQRMERHKQIRRYDVLKQRDMSVFTEPKTRLVPMEELQNILERLELAKSYTKEQHQECSYVTSRDYDVANFDWLQQDNDGDNGLMLAIIHKREDIFSCLLKHITSYSHLNVQNNLGQSCLHLAVVVNAPIVVKKLVAWGADVTQMDRNGNTPLHLACAKGYSECINVLTTPLVYSDISERPYYVPFSRIPQNPELRNHDGFTCLQIAAGARNLPVMDYLLRRCHADINAIDWRTGDTVLHHAIQTGNRNMLRLLLQFRSLDIDIERYDGLNALDLARLNSDVECFKVLKSFGATDKHARSYTQTGLLETANNSVFEDSYNDLKIAGEYISDHVL